MNESKVNDQIEARARRFIVAIIAGLILYLIAFVASLPWQTRPSDEIAVVVALPIIAVISAVEILVYVLDTILIVTLQRIIKRTGTRVGNTLQVPPIELKGTFSGRAVLLTILFATFCLAFLITVALLHATGIEWALPTKKVVGISVLVVTGLAYLYGWVWGALDRQARGQPEVFLAYRIAVTLLWSLGLARGAGRA